MSEICEITLGKRGLSRRVRDLAVNQAGVVARWQLLEHGVKEAAIDRARQSGRLFDVHPGVYSVTPPELLNAEGRTIAAMLAVGLCTFLAHLTSAWHWKLIAYEPGQIHLGTRHEHVEPDGVSLHRFSTLRPGDLTRNGRFRSTTVPRTLLDLAVDYPRPRLVAVLAQAEFEHNTRPEDIQAVLRRGHPGSANLRTALKEHVPGYGEARSRTEKRFRRLLIKEGIELPERNQPVGPYKVDCLWPELGLVVELDGGQHERPGQAAVDAARDLWLRRNGYTVRRYGWEQIRYTPSDVIEDLNDAFAEARSKREATNPPSFVARS